MKPRGEITPDPRELDVFSWAVFDSAGELAGCGRTYPRARAADDCDHALRAVISSETELGDGAM